MAISVKDIQEKQFSTQASNGYNVEQVDDFLDELAEFPRGVLEVLRQPLEEKCIHLARQQGAYLFPADFMLVAASNPCPCGMAPGPQCTCTSGQIRNYQGKISQPFLDRIDICMAHKIGRLWKFKFSEIDEWVKSGKSAL